MGHPILDIFPPGLTIVYPSSPSHSQFPDPQFFHTDPACSTFFSSSMNINGSIPSKPSNSFSTTSPSPTATATTNVNKPIWIPSSPASSSTAPLTMNPSRKRSRDDYTASSSSTSFSIEDDQRDSGFGSAATSSPTIEEADPTYGDAMVILKDSEWQSTKMHTDELPCSDLPSRKSQRLDTSAASSSFPAACDDNTIATIQAKLQSTSQNLDNNYRDHHPKRQPSSSSFTPLTPQEPQLDSITLLLGISWQRVSRTDDVDVAAALRGWERYIQNHYAPWIAQAEILLKHRGLGAFLVAGRIPGSDSGSTSPSTGSTLNTNTNLDADGTGTGTGTGNGKNWGAATHFYLFSEDLTEARLVGNDWDSCLRNLREVPIRYEDGSVVLKASASTASTASTMGTGAERVEGVARIVVEDKGVLIGCVSDDDAHVAGGGVGGSGHKDIDGDVMGMGMGMGMDIDW
ncbi:hypothetical protein ACJ72_07714 [Emergomyces africanus]|uniref:Uncharacterized protein n=1 Tax=Emergomyces africanus TaxID=1955775 RepID=A0A1B7NN04_9EURO|nr:hypothetical protein ACJ72_07714 [Emergomyces africanus]